MWDRLDGGSPPSYRPQSPRGARTRPASMGEPHGKNATQDPNSLCSLSRMDPCESRRARGINRWKARCAERCTPGLEGGCPEKARNSGTSPGSPPYRSPTTRAAGPARATQDPAADSVTVSNSHPAGTSPSPNPAGINGQRPPAAATPKAPGDTRSRMPAGSGPQPRHFAGSARRGVDG